MEGLPRTHESDVMQICVIAIETAARKMNISSKELVERLEKQNLIEGRLFKFYETLHTQSANYVADDIIETLQNYENDGKQYFVSNPISDIGRTDLDFGPGFYVTNNKNQAEKWAKTKASRKHGQKAILNIYHFNQEDFTKENKYSIMVFPKYNIKWLDFIAYSRKGKHPWENFDWIEGGIVNDSVITTVDAYADGIMSAEAAMDRLVQEELRQQVCIRKQEIIDKYLTKVESIEIK